MNLSDFPKYEVLRFEFLSNFVVLIFLIVFLHTCLNILPLIYQVLGQNLNLLHLFLFFYLDTFPHLLIVLMPKL